MENKQQQQQKSPSIPLKRKGKSNSINEETDPGRGVG